MTFNDYRVEVKAEMHSCAIAALYEACGEICSQAQRNSRVKTGKTKDSYQYTVDEDKLEGYVGSNYENAIWEEFGTGEYALNGDGRKGGWFYRDASGKGHFTHGKKAKRPLLRAFLSTKGNVEKIMKSRFAQIDQSSSLRKQSGIKGFLNDIRAGLNKLNQKKNQFEQKIQEGRKLANGTWLQDKVQGAKQDAIKNLKPKASKPVKREIVIGKKISNKLKVK